jgi:hypothetical protein
MISYEQLLTSDCYPDYAKLEKSDCESYDVIVKSTVTACSERENVVADVNMVTDNRQDHLTKVDHTTNIRCKLSVSNVQTVECDDYLTVVDDGDNDNYLIAIDDTRVTCQSSTKQDFATKQAKESSTSADNENDNKDYLVIFGESCSNSTAYPTDGCVIPVDNANEPFNSAPKSEQLVAAAEATSQGYTALDDGMLTSTSIREARSYNGSFDVHNRQLLLKVASVPDYDNTTETLSPNDYDNNAGLSARAINVSIYVADYQFRAIFSNNFEKH